MDFTRDGRKTHHRPSQEAGACRLRVNRALNLALVILRSSALRQLLELAAISPSQGEWPAVRRRSRASRPGLNRHDVDIAVTAGSAAARLALPRCLSPRRACWRAARPPPSAITCRPRPAACPRAPRSARRRQRPIRRSTTCRRRAPARCSPTTSSKKLEDDLVAARKRAGCRRPAGSAAASP